MKRFLCLLFVFLWIFPVSPLAEEEAILYVAADGSEEYRTVHEAVEAARELGGAVRIVVGEGTYTFSEPLQLLESDSNLTICAKEGEQVIFTGGMPIPFELFEPVTDQDVLRRIVMESGREQILQLKLSDAGITDYGEIKIQGFLNSGDNGYASTLTFEGQQLPIACYPNGTQEYLMSTQVLEDGSGSTAVQGNLKEIQIKINSDRYRYWTEAEEIWSLAYLCHDWADSTVPVSFDFETGVVNSYVGGSYYAKTNRRIKFFNLLEEMDAPGEWYVDKNEGILYLIPPEGSKAGDTLIFTSYNQNLVTVTKSKNITFQGISFTGTRAYGAYVNKADGIVFEDCEFSSIGGAAVYLNACYRSGVRDSYFHDLGSWGVYMNKCGDRTNLIPGECFAENSEFERFSQYKRTYSPAVHMYEDVGNRVSHCEFHDAPHFAIRYDSNDNVIEYSEFYDLCQETADTGAIYTGRYWNTRGNEIRYNYFHDLYLGNTPTSGLYGVYLDDAHSSTRVHHNLFYRVSTVSLMGGGRDNTFTNNMMVDCNASLIFDARCTTWMAWEEGSGIRTNTDRQKNWQTSEVWSKYPNLQNLYEDEPQYPKYNVIENNILLNTPAFKINEYVSRYGTVQNNISVTDTAVVKDYENGDYSPSGQAAEIAGLEEFDSIPMEQIGVQKKITSSAYQPKTGEQSRLAYLEDYRDYEKKEINGIVLEELNSVTLQAGTKSEDGKFKIPGTRMIKSVDVPIFRGRQYHLSMEHSILPVNGDSSIGLSLTNGLVFDQKQFTCSQNGNETTVSNGEYYYYPVQVSQRTPWEAEYQFDRSMNLQSIFFVVQSPNRLEKTDVWGGGIRYTIYNWKLVEKTKFHQIKFDVTEGGRVTYTNQDWDGQNKYRNAPVEHNGLVEAEDGTAPVITVIPDEGYQLTAVKQLNGELIHYNSETPVTLTLSDLSQSGTLGISFAKTAEYNKAPGLATQAFYVFEKDAQAYTVTDGKTETGPMLYFYAAVNGYEYSDDSEAGFLMSNSQNKTYRLPVLNKNGTVKSVTPFQRFGIKVFGPGVQKGTAYTVSPYVREGEEIVTGEQLTVAEK